MTPVDALEQVISEAREPTRRHEAFHLTCMKSVLDVLRHFETARNEIVDDDTEEARQEYNSMCIALAKVAAMAIGLSVGTGERAKRESRLMLSLALVFLGEIVNDDMVIKKEEMEFAKVLRDSLEPVESVH